MNARAVAAQRAEILLVDDDEDHAYLTRMAFGKAVRAATLHHVTDGRKCLQFLRRQAPYQAAPVPDLILLDLDMPVMSGPEVLAEIVADEALRHLPVVVLTAHDEQAEVVRMYRLRCNSYICKPADLDTYVDLIRKFADYWLSAAILPSRRAH